MAASAAKMRKILLAIGASDDSNSDVTDPIADPKAKAGEISGLAFDLQQSLPTPKLTCGPAFDKRKIWTLNEGVHDLGTDTGYV